MAEKTYLQAISDGLRQEMRRDKRVFVIGEDVGVYGGAFKVTLGFQEEFGAWRVIDAPLSETAIVGGCTGAAIMGMRPVAEMQFADFISCAWDHLVTVAAKQRYRAGTPVPIVVRLPSGGGFSGGPFHSQNPESSFAHIAGLKVVCPATPEDAKGLLVTAIVGGCTGAAIMGLRPVAEMQFSDFISCGWDQLVTVAAKQRWRAGTPVPITVRLPSGGGFSGGPFHSQNPESSFAHIPGLKVICPATPEDAKGLLASAIQDPNPCLYFEHKHLYRRIKAEVPDERYETPFGKARVHQEGDDLSVITWGAMVYTAEEAAQQLDGDGVSVEILDLLAFGLQPLCHRPLGDGDAHLGHHDVDGGFSGHETS